ncbi:MAG: UbiA family prenyltransferase [Persicimonas sp.]
MRAFFFSNIWVAAAAAALTLQTTYCLDDAHPVSASLFVLVFCATLFIYNLDRLVSASREDAVELTDRHRFIQRHRRLLWGLAAAASLGVAASLFFVSPAVWWGLLPLGVVSLAYSLPILKGDQARRLKDLPGVKIFVIALVWGSVTVLLPALEAGIGRRLALWGPVFAERFVFIFAITLPFDVRDLERDRSARISTLPMWLGPTRTRWLSVALIALFIALVVIAYGPTWRGPTPALALSGLISAVALWFGDRRRGELYYVGLLDGLMVLQASLVVAHLEWVVG